MKFEETIKGAKLSKSLLINTSLYLYLQVNECPFSDPGSGNTYAHRNVFPQSSLIDFPENAYMLEVKYAQRTLKNMELLKSCLAPSFAYGAVNLMQCH